LHEALLALLEVDPIPVVVLHVEGEHFVGDLTILELASEDNHGSGEDGSIVVFTREDINALGLRHDVGVLDRIIYKNLVSALPNLSLPIEHEAASKRINLIIEGNRGVALSSLELLSALILHVAPLWFVVFHVLYFEAFDLQERDLPVGVEVQAAGQVGSVGYACQS